MAATYLLLMGASEMLNLKYVWTSSLLIMVYIDVEELVSSSSVPPPCKRCIVKVIKVQLSDKNTLI